MKVTMGSSSLGEERVFFYCNVLLHGFNAWEMKFFQDFFNVKVGYFEKIGVEQPPVGRRSLKPQ